MEIGISIETRKSYKDYLSNCIKTLHAYGLGPEYFSFGERSKRYNFNFKQLLITNEKEGIEAEIIRKSNPSYVLFYNEPTNNDLGGLLLSLRGSKRNLMSLEVVGLFKKLLDSVSEPEYGHLELDQYYWQRHKDVHGNVEDYNFCNITVDGIGDLGFMVYFSETIADYLDFSKIEKKVKVTNHAKGKLIQCRESLFVKNEQDIEREQEIINHLGPEYFWQPPNKKAKKIIKFEENMSNHQKQGQTENTATTFSKEENDDLSHEMVEVAKEAIDLAKETFEIDLDFTEASIKKIDNILAKHFSKDNENIEQISLYFGAIVGEIIKQNIGGEWQYYDFDGQVLTALADVGKKDSTIFPMNKVSKRIEQGKGDDLVSYYKVLKMG